jgi:hypothetical protein
VEQKPAATRHRYYRITWSLRIAGERQLQRKPEGALVSTRGRGQNRDHYYAAANRKPTHSMILTEDFIQTGRLHTEFAVSENLTGDFTSRP